MYKELYILERPIWVEEKQAVFFFTVAIMTKTIQTIDIVVVYLCIWSIIPFAFVLHQLYNQPDVIYLNCW